MSSLLFLLILEVFLCWWKNNFKWFSSRSSAHYLVKSTLKIKPLMFVISGFRHLLYDLTTCMTKDYAGSAFSPFLLNILLFAPVWPKKWHEFQFPLPGKLSTAWHLYAWMEMSGWQNVARQFGNLTTWFMKAHQSVSQTTDHTDCGWGKDYLQAVNLTQRASCHDIRMFF